MNSSCQKVPLHADLTLFDLLHTPLGEAEKIEQDRFFAYTHPQPSPCRGPSRMRCAPSMRPQSIGVAAVLRRKQCEGLPDPKRPQGPLVKNPRLLINPVQNGPAHHKDGASLLRMLSITSQGAAPAPGPALPARLGPSSTGSPRGSRNPRLRSRTSKPAPSPPAPGALSAGPAVWETGAGGWRSSPDSLGLLAIPSQEFPLLAQWSALSTRGQEFSTRGQE